MAAVPASLHELIAGAIDYAGLFPPAALDMQTSVANYLRYLDGPNAWALGRFVVPASRLTELRAAAQGRDIPLSVLLGRDLAGDFELALQAQASTIELRAATVQELCGTDRIASRGVSTFVEIPIDEDPRSLIAAMAESGVHAKLRMGGLTSAAFPAAQHVARFLSACTEHKVAFKATAGLHHPLRGVYPVSEAEGCERAAMCGFLNLFMAAALLRSGAPTRALLEVLEDSAAPHFQFTDEFAGWQEHRIPLADIGSLRREFILSFGSCSFEEPIASLEDLRSL